MSAESTRRARLQIEPEAADSEDALACVDRYRAELRERFPSGFEPVGASRAGFADLMAPGGRFLVVRRGGTACGCGGVRTLEPGLGEIKQMWLDPDVRGRGGGRLLLEALEDAARQLGHRRLRLDTSRHLAAAQRLYTAAGYQAIADYNRNPYADFWFEKSL